MKTTQENLGLRHTAVALAVFAAFGSVHAQQSVTELTTPENSIRVGGGWVSGDSKDRAIFGQYNGLRNDNAFGLVDIDYLTRDEAAGLWTAVKGVDLGLSTRELSIMRQKQGDWTALFGYSELERINPRTVNTGMTGVGTTAPTVVRLATPGTGTDYDLTTTRKGENVDFEKWLSTTWQFQASFKNEDKNGARLWGRGYDCNAAVCNGNAATQVKNAVLFVPEPISSNIKQIDARLNFHDEQWMLSVGYYGSFYSNLRGNLSPVVPNVLNNGLGNPATLYPAVAGGTSLQNVLQSPMALAPDNQAHQFYVDGHYAFTPTTRANFKFAYAHATQTDSFAGMGLSGAPVGANNLDARVDNIQAQGGISSRPIDKLWLLANATYEDKEDTTPRFLYNIEPGTPPALWKNNHVTMRKFVAKLEASYDLLPGYRGILGADYRSINREVPTNIADDNVAGLSALRAQNSETGWRAELRRSMSETLNGMLSYSSSRRGGSDWTSLNTSINSTFCGGLNCYGQVLPGSSIIGLSATSIFPVQMADVERNKWKLTADWAPTEKLNLNLYLENGRDTNTSAFSPVAGGKGWRDSDFKLYSIDVSYAISDNWNLTGYASYGDSTQHINHSTGYQLGLRNRNDAAGLNLTGKLYEKFHVGGSLTYLNDKNEYGIDAAPSATGAPPSATNLAQAAIGLPDVKFKTTILDIFGTYALQKNSDLRFDLIYQRTKFTEWSWSNNGVPFTYADNTTVSMQPDQNVTAIGVSYIYRFR